MICLTRGSSKLLRPWVGFREGEADRDRGGGLNNIRFGVDGVRGDLLEGALIPETET